MPVTVPDGPRRAAADLLRAILTFVFLGVMTPLWLYLELPEARSGEDVALFALALTEYCAMRLAVMAYAGAPRLLAICFFTFIYVWGGLTAFVQTYVWQFPWSVRHVPADTEIALAMVVVAVAAYETGQLSSRIRSHRPLAAYEFRISDTAVVWICVAALGLMLAGTFMLGGTAVLFETRAGFDAAVAASSGSKAIRLIGVALMRSPVFVALVLVAVTCQQKWRGMRRGKKRLYLGLLLLMGAANLVANYPLALTRAWLGTVGLTLLFALLPWRRSWAASLACGLVALMIFAFPLADAFRNALSADASHIEKALDNSPIDNLLHKGDYDVFQMTVNGYIAVETLGIAWGRNLFGAALFWFPRTLWPDKPLGTGFIIGILLGYDMVNLSAPLWLEGYWAFGWLGLILIMWTLGHVSGRLDRAYHRALNAGVHGLIRVLVPFVAAFQFIALRGDLLNGIAIASVALATFFTSVRLARAEPAYSGPSATSDPAIVVTEQT